MSNIQILSNMLTGNRFSIVLNNKLMKAGHVCKSIRVNTGTNPGAECHLCLTLALDWSSFVSLYCARKGVHCTRDARLDAVSYRPSGDEHICLKI